MASGNMEWATANDPRTREKNERMAKQLSDEASERWNRAVSAVRGLPRAAVLTSAASTLYAAGVIERGVEKFRLSIASMRHSMETELRREKRFESLPRASVELEGATVTNGRKPASRRRKTPRS